MCKEKRKEASKRAETWKRQCEGNVHPRVLQSHHSLRRFLASVVRSVLTSFTLSLPAGGTPGPGPEGTGPGPGRCAANGMGVNETRSEPRGGRFISPSVRFTFLCLRLTVRLTFSALPPSYARLTLRLSSFHSSTSRSDRAPEEREERSPVSRRR